MRSLSPTKPIRPGDLKHVRPNHPPPPRRRGPRRPLGRPFIASAEAAAPLLLRCSLDSPPSHPRNIDLRDFLGRIERASGGAMQTRLFESGSLYPDPHVVKALLSRP
jgi:hypothetical protein